MSRIGKMPVTIPAGVEVTIGANNEVTVKGPKGELHQVMPAEMAIAKNGDTIDVTRPSDIKRHKALHGLTRSLLHNMVVGVTDSLPRKSEKRDLPSLIRARVSNTSMSISDVRKVRPALRNSGRKEVRI